jgi:proline dehydrogenase
MERASGVDRVLDAFEEVARTRDNVGVCLQSYLRRTERDLDRLLAGGRPVRLVKGYYHESPEDVFPSWREVTENFSRLVPRLILRSRRPAIGTHDRWLVEQAERALARVPIAAGRESKASAPLECQLFLGANPRLAEDLVRRGRPVRVYVPYGSLLPYVIHTFPQMDFSRNVQRVLGFRMIR